MLERFKRIRVRLLLCGIIIVFLLIPSCITQAQYKWILNGYVSLAAGADYFGSNYLMELDESNAIREVKTYYGWDGKDYPLPDIEIRNYVNALLTSTDTNTMPYKLTCKIDTKTSTGATAAPAQKCSLEITRSNDNGQNTIKTTNKDETMTINGSLLSANGPAKDTYMLTIKAPEGADNQLGEGYFVRIELNADNASNTAANSEKRFEQRIGVVFNYYVSPANQYIKQFDILNSGFSNFKLIMGTGTIPEINYRPQTVVVWWKNDKIEIDPFNYGFLIEDKWKMVTVGGITKLYMNDLGSNSHRQLNFKLLDSTITDVTSISKAPNNRPENAGDAYMGAYVDTSGTQTND